MQVELGLDTFGDTTLGGVIAAETPTSVTLRRADGAEDPVLRANLESLRSTRLSLMPEDGIFISPLRIDVSE